MRTLSAILFWLSFLALPREAVADYTFFSLKDGVRGLVTRASEKVVIDGSLSEWSRAYCTPLLYNAKNLENRASQCFYMWYEKALYLGLRCRDKNQANHALLGGGFSGDRVEFYFDTRAADARRSKEWTSGAIHFYFTPFDGTELKPRWIMRQGIVTSETLLKGVEFAATHSKVSYEIKFKIPWSNFPKFQPKIGALLDVDAEVCFGDRKFRTDRTFAYISPLSVQQPSSLGMVELVESFSADDLAKVGPTSFPLWVETPWEQP